MSIALSPEKKEKIKSLIREYEEHVAAIVDAPVIISITLTPVTIEEGFIRSLVIMQFDKEWPEIIAKSRKRELVAARSCYAYLCRKYLGISYNDIGKNLVGRHHTTAMSLYNNAVNYLATNDPLICNNLTPLINRLDEARSRKSKQHELEV